MKQLLIVVKLQKSKTKRRKKEGPKDKRKTFKPVIGNFVVTFLPTADGFLRIKSLEVEFLDK